MIDTGIVPTVYDRILTLSTCTGNGHATRWVVQAVLKGVAPSDSAQEAVQPEPAAEQAPEPADTPQESREDTPADAAEPIPEEQSADAPEQEAGEADQPSA